MPIGFLSDSSVASGIFISKNERNIIKFLAEMAKASGTDDESDFQVSLVVDLSFRRTQTDSAALVNVSTDPSAIKVTLTEEDIRLRYPWDYEELTRKLSARYSDFKRNKKYHAARIPIRSNPKYVNTRMLDPRNPRSSKKDFYSSNVFEVFDSIYVRR